MQVFCASWWLFEYRWMTLENPCGVASTWHLFVVVTELLEGTAGNLWKDWSSIFHWADNRHIYLFDLYLCISHANGKDECVCDCLFYVILCSVQDFLWLIVPSIGNLHDRYSTLPSFPFNANTQWISSMWTDKA